MENGEYLCIIFVIKEIEKKRNIFKPAFDRVLAGKAICLSKSWPNVASSFLI